jgi:hypothetical protein
MRKTKRARSNFVWFFSTLVCVFASSVQATPVLHEFYLEDSSGGTVYTGTVTVDSSRLTPNTFTAFSDPNFVAFSLTIGSESWSLADAFNPATEGVITDGNGMIDSFLDTTGTVALLTNDNGARIDIWEDKTLWSTSASAAVTVGTTHSFARVPLPVPVPLTLSLLGAGFLGMNYWRSRQRA